jgi:hypothetical protein
MAGPGSYDWDGPEHVGYAAEFSWGRTASDAARIETNGEDDEYTTDYDGLSDGPEPVSHEDIAARIVALLEKANAEYGPRSDMAVIRHAFVPAADRHLGNLYRAEYRCGNCGRQTDMTSVNPITTYLCMDCEFATRKGDTARLAFLAEHARENAARRAALIAEGKLATYASSTLCKVCGYHYEQPGQHLS